MKDVCIVYILDPSPNNHIAEEAIISSKSFRLNAGKYKDIPIYFIMPSSKKYDDAFRKSLDELFKIRGTIQITNKIIPLEDSIKTDGFIAKSAGLWFASENLTHEYILYVDCDTVFLKEPPFEKLRNCVTLRNHGLNKAKGHLKDIINYSNELFNKLYFETVFYAHKFGWVIFSRADSGFWKDYYHNYLSCIEKFDKIKGDLIQNKEVIQKLGANPGNEENFIRGLIDEVVLEYLSIKYNSHRIRDTAEDDELTDDTWLYHFKNIDQLKQKFRKEIFIQCLL